MIKIRPIVLLSAFVFTVALAAQQPDDGAATPSAPEQQLPMQQAMQANMQRMRELMARIHGTSDPAERRQLMSEHMRAMGEAMPMMGGGMGQPRHAACAEGDLRCEVQRMQDEQQTMQRRMDAMQGLMGQLMEHMMQSGPAAAPTDEPVAPPRPGAGAEGHESHH